MPRIERLCRKLNLKPFEKRIMQLMVVSPLSDDFQRKGAMMRWRGVLTYTGLATQFDVSLEEVIDFFSSNRKQVKEGLISAFTHINMQPTPITETALNVLLGVPLKPTQFLAIESALLGEIVREEPGFEDTPAGKAVLGGEDDMPDGLGLEKQSSYLEQLRSANNFQEESLYTILKKEEFRERQEFEARQQVDLGPALPAEGAEGVEGAEGAELVSPPGLEGEEGVLVSPPSGAEPGGAAETKEEAEENEDDAENLKPYASDLQYLQDQFALVAMTIKIARLKKQIEDALDLDEDEQQQYDPYAQDAYDPITGRMLAREQLSQKRESNLRKFKNKERLMKKKIEQRLSLSRKNGPWLPRMERLSHALALQPFEKNVIISMIGAAIAPSVVNFQGMRMGAGAVGSTRCTVNDLLNCFCGSLEEQIKSRKYFYKSAILVKEGILNLHGTDFAGDLTECTVEIDRRMLDFVVGLDTEFSEIVDGSHLYSPSVDFEDVILPVETKQLLLQTVENFDTYKLVQKNLDVDKKIAYGRGMALLFYGSSGTGKTMTANALATKLGKKVLLINFPYLGNNEAGQIIKLIFREAKIHDAILFFDECESIFQSRDKGSNRVNMILTELERHDGLSILATNRPYDLDEAMYRRINLAVEFRKPDHILRERIWHALKPEKLQLADDVLISELAMKYELTGGFIKNTWLGALSLAVSRDGINPVICHEDLKQGAAHQLRGRLGMIDFDRRVVPTRGLEDVVLPDNLKSSLTEIVEYGKAQAILFGQWGFQKQHGTSKGIAALFHGPPGTGKTMAAEAIGYDLGKPLKVVNCAQLISKWVGESQKNIEAVFDEARQVDAVVVFDEAEGLFGSRADTGGDGAGRHDSMNVGILLHHIETFPGVVVVITNMRERIDPAFFRRFKFVMEFPVPDAEHRKKLWRLLLPTEAPLAADVDLDVLANRYVMAGGNIKSVVFRAASRAALRKDAASRVITMADLTSASEEEMQKEIGSSSAHLSMYN